MVGDNRRWMEIAQGLKILMDAHSTPDTRPNEGYSFDGLNEKGFYKFSWANP